jgi:hypothetical protein
MARTIYGVGFGCAGCLFDSVSGPFTSKAAAREFLRDEARDGNEDAPAGDRLIRRSADLWAQADGMYYGEVFEAEHDTFDDED